ncbi:ABC transporter ATP-binding protein [Comamonas endophytica]|uniref:ABC transporter ATP-binding protein n=1 Tax=Comamonas endophytica TaxID=2949090 RepID=A0ABY6G5Y1_9BURK|nr:MULTISPECIES: ABC transporter ATP-binding protein [unclassified Acidovorax]MCD2511019.1 ABC transporter ATP-binding protein [Acidovorax sp. D4N7]UYG50426.1 ABC transporter ATP-binding protein [Acidovorax sp. 5MLIR]
MNTGAHTASAPEEVLRLEDVTMRISGLTAVDHLGFGVTAGQIVSLIGPNGAGKTTTFNVISGYMRATTGRVRLFGEDVTGLSPERIAQRGLVRSFQRTSVFAGCTVYDNILTGLHLRGRGGVLQALLRGTAFRQEEQRLRAEADEILGFIGLRARAGELANGLSYGEQRLLGVGLALAAQPRVLLLDEPAAGLNPSETEAFKHMVRRIRDRGVTILLVEHDMHMVMSISDHIVVLNHGKLIATGAPQAIQQNPEVIRAYLGTGIEHAQA